MIDSENCPECGGPTTEKGITTTDGQGATWRSCLNCEWSA